ncbi:MAG TPA: ATP-binding protein [Phototrophicaceae bacterium]|nr:ATP-binding protein [Phototrophicaceae bacterium]
MKTIAFLQSQSRRFILVLVGVLILIIGALDYVTGLEISFSNFYLIPIVIAAWFISRRAGIVASVASCLIWLLGDLSSGRIYSSSAIPYWNITMRFGFFLIVTLILRSLYEAQAQQEELQHFIVHDLRAPLSNILSAQEMLRDIGSDTMDSDQQKLVSMSISSSNRLMTLINSLLDLARLENGKMELKIEPTDVQKLFDTASQQVATLALRSEAAVAQAIDPSAKMVLADTQITVRVLVNLLSNALNYSPTGSTVTITAVPDQNQMISIRVIDQGHGIPPEWVDKVFDKFTQVEARKSGIGIGSGLGLSFCRLAVEAEGGRIRVESELGKGTSVIFTLPRSA